MLRLFTFIIACCLVYLTVTSLMESKNSENMITETPPIPIPESPTSGVAEGKGMTGGDPGFAQNAPTANGPTDSESPNSDAAAPAHQDDEESQVDKELEELARQLEEDEPPYSADLGTPPARKGGPHYTKEDSWHYTARAENDLAELDNLLTN